MMHPLKLKNETIPGYYINERFEIYSELSNKILSPFANKENKPVVWLIINNQSKMVRLDYLVISTFKTFYDDIIHIIHLDDNDFNCNLDNLLIVRKSDIINKYKNMYKVDDLIEISEDWKIYPSFPSIEVSNFGNVRNIDNKEMIKQTNSHGYLEIHLNRIHYLVHRLVAELFVENPRPDKYFYVNHIDGNKANNIFYNLEWCNISMNTEHAFLTGLQNNKYSEEEIKTVCELLAQGLSHVEISIITGMNRKYISEIYRGRKHKAISSQYNFTKKIPLSELYNKDVLLALIKSGYKPKEIASLIKTDYNQSFVSYYERLRREIK